ncbi:uncharacterized protein LACBIDRAFT_307089 [Laccaria bicolor S238N-H82]|uniref:Predicted protein n=1 Tax=Laccaria bicolor (strain S238N-H82 / ATCC MYA-4686) TaxID=486041 RepID=B0DPD1_LACBS|nr:uncharacterized protein LACBIDRAFT_307089 [Laccaria bicolor S238N-H82]EDR03661.1 predicted protein [Laccaria bicolor S238N-H82]|eukprot:XP_001885809.1 predicted protein [Laccaria bicolor S238N-H82]
MNLNVKDGISLLSLKDHTMPSYIHTMPTQPLSTTTQTPRRNSAGDFVNSIIEGHVVFEKIGALES